MENIISIENMDFKGILHILLHQEKVSRNESDIETNRKVLMDILELHIKHAQWDSLGDCVRLVVEKHSCMQETVQKFIGGIIKILGDIPDVESRCNLIKALRGVCDGKLYLEREHVDVTRILANLYESTGRIREAADVLSEVKIEAYGHLNQKEKVEFILLQMRLMIKSEQKDKAAILSKKIQLKFFENPENEELKIKFYDMKIELERWTSYLDTSKYYQILSLCQTLQPGLRSKMFVNSAIFCALAPKSFDQIMFTQRLLNDKAMLTEPTACELLKLLSSKELISSDSVRKSFQSALDQTKVMDRSTRFGQKCLADLDQRIVEHNILTISSYYSRITLSRMSQLIGTSEKKCEENIALLVTNGLLMTARIDRFTGIVDFSAICIRECYLNSWSDTICKLMDSTNKASHQVQKEFSLNARNVHEADLS